MHTRTIKYVTENQISKYYDRGASEKKTNQKTRKNKSTINKERTNRKTIQTTTNSIAMSLLAQRHHQQPR